MNTPQNPPQRPLSRPRVAPGVAIFPGGEDFALVETEEELYRVKSPAAPIFVRAVLPLLTGEHTLEQILDRAEAHIEREYLLGMLRRFHQMGIIEDAEQEAESLVHRSCTVLLCGRDPLLGELTARIETPAVRLRQVTVEALPEALDQTPSDARLVLAVSDRAQDPLLRAINSMCLSRRAPVLFASYEKKQEAIIGPLWLPGRCLPCFECLLLRINLNHEQGKLRHEYAHRLHEAGFSPSPMRRSRGLSLVMAGLIERCVNELMRPGEAEHRLAGHVLWLDDGAAHEIRRTALLPAPYCPACHRLQAQDERTQSVRREGLATAAAPRLGIISREIVVGMGESDPRIFSHAATVPDLALLHSGMKSMTHSGAGVTPEAARFAALGESIERYAASLYRSEALELAEYRQVRDEATHPESFVLFSDEQYAGDGFPFHRFTETTLVRWTRGYRYSNGKPVLIPASLVYLPYRRTKEEALLAPSLSTGLAAGPSLEAAILSGIYEVVERDAVTNSWWNRIPPRYVNPALIEHRASLTHIYPARDDVAYHIYDLTLDVPLPVIVALALKQDGQRTLLHVGGACRRSPFAALDKALLEASQSFPYVRNLLNTYADWSPGNDFERVDSFQKHAVLYSKFPELRERVGYLLIPEAEDRSAYRPLATSGTPEAPSNDVAADLRHTVGVVEECGYEVLVVDLTTPDLRQIGVHVVRVVIPGLLHLSGNHLYRFLSKRRLDVVKGRLGDTIFRENRFPHPYP